MLSKKQRILPRSVHMWNRKSYQCHGDLGFGAVAQAVIVRYSSMKQHGVREDYGVSFQLSCFAW
jgi:hypothetical protein